MRHIISFIVNILLLAICFCETGYAQNTSKESGTVRIGFGAEDSFTHVGLPAFMTLLNSDSVVVDTITCTVYQGNSFAMLYIPKVSGEYTLRAEYPGYKTAEIKESFDFSKNLSGWGFPSVQLKRLPTAVDSLKSVGLDEVVVRGTRLQVAYRGDTLVYDAQAFNIPEGAMLDALVRQLPGAEMKANGDVYINGKKLDYITLNGNDFFKGSNKVILENLPYFVVKELQVYHKDPPFALVKPTTDAERDYVLDVVMKREYAIGTIANMETGIGTDDRWKVKAFGLRHNDYTRLSIFANLNNLNENQTPGADGDWSPKKQSRGLQTTKQTGLNLNVNNAKKTLSLDHSTIFEWADKNTTLQRRSETFSKEDNILGRTSSVSDVKDFTLTNNTKANIKIGRSRISTSHYIVYTDQDAATSSADSTFRTSLINTDRQTSLYGSRHFYGNGSLSWGARLFGTGSTNVTVNYSFNSLLHDKRNALRNIHYLNTGTTDGRNDYQYKTSQTYRYVVTLSQHFTLSPKASLAYSADYEQKGQKQDNSYYRLYQYGGRYEEELVLPSTTDSLTATLDRGNSYNHFTLGRGVGSTLVFNYSWKNTFLSLSAKYTYMHERIRYQNAQQDTVAKRSYGSWNPNVIIQHEWKKNTINFQYSAYNMRPQFALLMPLTNNANTLYVRINNPELRSQLRHTIKADLNMRPGGMKPSWWLKYEFIALNKAWGTRMSYNTTTGGYSTMADNVDGNWNTSMSFGMNGPIDGKKRWRYDVSAKVGYTHSVDFGTAYDDADNDLSRVNTVRPTTTWKLTYRKGNFSAGAVAKYTGNYSHEEEYGLRDMSVNEYQFGVNTQYTIPVVKLTIGTDLNLYSQNGYDSDMMNTDDWVWNASISRPFLKGRLVAKVEMYDILHQLSARSYSINAQSKVETYYNSIPHYMMFSLGYKFAKNPKKTK